MSGLESDVVAAIVGDPTVSGIIGNRVAPLRAGQRIELPYLTYQVVSRNRPRVLNGGGVTGLCHTRLQVDAFAGDYESAVEIAAAVRRLLDGNPSAIGDHVRTVALDDEDDTTAERDDGTGEAVYRRTLDFLIWHRED